jgi:hypothetical protein
VMLLMILTKHLERNILHFGEKNDYFR